MTPLRPTPFPATTPCVGVLIPFDIISDFDDEITTLPVRPTPSSSDRIPALSGYLLDSSDDSSDEDLNMYEPQSSEDYQNTAREDSPIEVAAPPPAPAQLKSSRRRQKRTAQNVEAPRCTAWTNEEEITLCKGWVHVSKNNVVGNARKECGFWTEVLRYMESKTKAPDRQTYDMLNGNWKMVRPNMARFFGVHANVMRIAQASRPGDEDYFATTLLDYEAEFGVPFTLRHCWEDKVKGSKKKGARSSKSSTSMNDEALARLMVSELAMHNERSMSMKKEEHLAFLEIRKREVEIRE
ncbi:hypothetical protein Tco_1087285 [Tanacetum coccineum]